MGAKSFSGSNRFDVISMKSSLIIYSGSYELVVFKPGALHPVTTATFKALTGFFLFGLWPKIHATRYAGGR
jgi:hypothetical protein